MSIYELEDNIAGVGNIKRTDSKVDIQLNINYILPNQWQWRLSSRCVSSLELSTVFMSITEPN